MSTPISASRQARWKYIKDQLAAVEERSLRQSARMRALFQRLSKASNRTPRVRPDVEEKMLKKMGKLMGFGHRFALTACPPAVVASIVSPPSTKKRKKKTRRRLKTYEGRLTREVNKRIFLVSPWSPTGSDYLACFPAWDHIAPITRALCYGMAIPAAQRFSMTLNPAQEITEAALRSDKGYAGYLQDRLRRYLKNATPLGQTVPNFVLVVEGWGRHEPLHLHGAISLAPGFLSGIAGKRIRDAIRAAGGIAKGSATGRELDIKPIHEAAGWFRYLGKRRMVAPLKIVQDRARLGMPPLDKKKSLIIASTPLRQAGKKWFEDARQSMDFVLWDRRRRR